MVVGQENAKVAAVVRPRNIPSPYRVRAWAGEHGFEEIFGFSPLGTATKILFSKRGCIFKLPLRSVSVENLLSCGRVGLV
jgi:hypothetical protein